MWEVPFARSVLNLTTVRGHDLWSFAVPKSLRCGIQWVSAPRLDVCSVSRRVFGKSGNLMERIGVCLLTLVIDFMTRSSSTPVRSLLADFPPYLSGNSLISCQCHVKSRTHQHDLGVMLRGTNIPSSSPNFSLVREYRDENTLILLQMRKCKKEARRIM